eukprot:TRINITY_DN9407_c0_g1_i2.p1 TRINITY_DN9407_c0_g1~~TRINITY_DN9407_c0_g1_i2.p1  ORF type:complete len:112 (+),score=20.96 TRINITY_DN9407_c0_g1_i2:109-444(+)
MGVDQIDKNEFRKWWQKPDRWKSLQLDDEGLETRRAAAQVFCQFDESGDGIISTTEFDQFYANLLEHQLTDKSRDACLRDLDSNGDGTIQFSEYVEWLARIGSIQIRVIFQ